MNLFQVRVSPPRVEKVGRDSVSDASAAHAVIKKLFYVGIEERRMIA